MRVTCPTCEQDFTSQWHYERHANRQNPCRPPREKVDELEQDVEELQENVQDLNEEID